jgi:hypothetical protein
MSEIQAFAMRLTQQGSLAAAKDCLAKQRAARGLPARAELAPPTVSVEVEVASKLRLRGVSPAEESAARAYLAQCKSQRS